MSDTIKNLRVLAGIESGRPTLAESVDLALPTELPELPVELVEAREDEIACAVTMLHRRELSEKVYNPGTVRKWKGGDYVKQRDGSWVPVAGKVVTSKPRSARDQMLATLAQVGVKADKIATHAKKPQFQAWMKQHFGNGWKKTLSKTDHPVHGPKPKAPPHPVHGPKPKAPPHPVHGYEDEDYMVKAYADAHGYDGKREMPWSETETRMQARSLMALGAETDVDTAGRIMSKAIDHTYNAFSPKKVFKHLEPFKDKIKVRPGREFSPAMYISGDAETLAQIQKLAKKMKADEADIYTDHEWHDGQYDGMKDGQSQYKNITRKIKMPGSVLRLWWD